MSVLILSGSGAVQAQETKAERLQQLRKALRGESADGDRPKPRHPPPKGEAVDMQLRALDELKQEDSSYSSYAGPSVGVVRTQSLIAEDPVTYTGLQLGLTMQPYSARGTVPLVSLGRRDLSGADPTWMLGFEARYLPWTSQLFGTHAVGLRAGIAYSRQDISLFAPSGAALANTELHALQSYILLSQTWSLAKSRRWSVNTDVGVSRFDMLLTSSSTLGEASDNIWLGVLRLGPSLRAGNFQFNLNYERRERLSEGWARLAENGVSLGVLYGIR